MRREGSEEWCSWGREGSEEWCSWGRGLEEWCS